MKLSNSPSRSHFYFTKLTSLNMNKTKKITKSEAVGELWRKMDRYMERGKCE